MKKRVFIFALVASLIGGFATMAAAYNGDQYCGSYENPCICEEVDEDGTCVGGPNGG